MEFVLEEMRSYESEVIDFENIAPLCNAAMRGLCCKLKSFHFI